MTLVLADLALPRPEEVEALIGRAGLGLLFEVAPDGLGRGKIVNDVDAGDAARLRPCHCFRRSAFDRGSHGHCRTRIIENCFEFFAPADLRREMSTKSNINGRGPPHLRSGRW